MEIRTLREDEIEQALTMSALAFGNRDGVPEALERGLGLYPADWYLGAFEGDEMTAMMRTLPYRMHINGGSLLTGLVSPVVSSHLHRRRGYAGTMLRRALEQMRERGQWLSALYTPHPSLYRRYGWEIAADERSYKFNPKDLRLTTEPVQRGSLRYVTEDQWQELDALHREHAGGRNGAIDRDELWWRNWVLRTWSGSPEAIVWDDDAGQPRGYMLYVEPGWSSRNRNRFVVTELVALTPDAHLNLLGVMAQQDIREEVLFYAPSDDPLPLLFVEEERLTIEQRHTVLLRVVDVPEALMARNQLAISDCDFTLEVTDRDAPWNQGTWRVTSTGGSVKVERAEGNGDVQLGVGVLAALFNGYVKPSMAARAGLLRSSESSVLPAMDRLFSVSSQPYFQDRF